MPVLSSVYVKSLRVGKTFQSGITYTQLGPAAILRASSRDHVSISHARSTRLPGETSGGYFRGHEQNDKNRPEMESGMPGMSRNNLLNVIHDTPKIFRTVNSDVASKTLLFFGFKSKQKVFADRAYLSAGYFKKTIIEFSTFGQNLICKLH